MIDATPPPPTTAQRHPAGGGIALGGIVILAAVLIGLAWVLFPAVWLAEQFALAGGQPFGRGVWLASGAGYAVVVLLVSLPAVALTSAPRYRAALRAWIAAGLFALLLLPIQLIPPAQAQWAAIAQIAALVIYLTILYLRRRNRGVEFAQTGRPVWPAFLAAALVVWPWVLWGALGSWLDTALNLTVALLFGLAAALTLDHVLFTAPDEGDPAPPLPFPVTGLVAGTALLIMGVALGHNGQQMILLFLLPALGWLATGVARWGRAARPEQGRGRAALLIGLVVAAPLSFVDPEELALILNLGARDVGYYALRATLLSAAIAFVLGLLAWPLSRRAAGRPLVPAALTAAVWLALAAGYFYIGQPGWHGERLYVILTEQADLSPAAAIADPLERRAFVYDSLTGHANATQAGLRAALDMGGIDYTPYYLVNALEVDGGPLVGQWLAARPEVDRVLDSPVLRPLPAPLESARGPAPAPTLPPWNLIAIGAPRVWEEFGVRGAGIVIGQSDSGVDGSHPEVGDQYRGNGPGELAGNDYNWLDPWYATPQPTDWGGHGTHTLGSALGRSVGVAPEATWIGCVNLARNLGNAPRYLDCLQFMLAPFPQDGDPWRDARPAWGANVLNNSWGCPEIEGCDPAALLPAVRALRAAGVFVVASAGNEGDACGTISAPISLYDEVFTVGAVDEAGQTAPFSSRGPVTADGSGRTKPDVVAPGVGVLSAFPGGTYSYSDGTSMAGPHVAGVVALLWSANPALIGDVDTTERILTGTAQPIIAPPSACDATADLPNNTTGYGLVDAYAAVAAALSR